MASQQSDSVLRHPSPVTNAVDGCSSVRPGVILTSGGATLDIATLAADSSGSPLLSLAESADRIREIASANATALIVADPNVIRGTEFPWTLHALTARGITFGVLFVTGTADDRVLCRKLLRETRLSSTGEGFVLVNSEERPGSDALSPLVRSRLPADLAERPVDLIVFSGHSGPLDARAGVDAILCSRADANGYQGPGVFSCYHDGICFRQRGRLPTIAPSAINAKVVVLAGCGTVTAGRSMFSASHNLVQLLLLGRAHAVIASCGVTFKVPELDLLCVSWILDGVPLGEVVARLNTISNRDLGQNGALPVKVGPFMLFGNPCARFDVEPPADNRAHTPARLPADVTLAASSIRDSLPLRADRAPALAIDLQEAVPSRFFFDEERSTLHVWKAAGTAGRFRIDVGDEDPYVHDRAPIQRAARNLPMWFGYLSSCLPAAHRAGQPTDVFRTMLTELPAWSTWSSYAYKRLMPRRSIPVSRLDTETLLAKDVRPKMRRWNGSLGRCLYHAVAGHRSLPLEEWSERFLTVGTTFRDRLCSCGEADRWGQRFRELSSDIERVLYQCTHCGPVGENDGIVQVRFDEIAAGVDAIAVACSTTAPEREHLYVAVGAVLDCRAARDSVPSDLVELEVPPGETRRIELTIPLSAEISPGVYSVWMPAVVNGVLCMEGRLVEIRPREGQPRS